MPSNELSTDYINKTYKSCGCIYISELDIIDNIINDKCIQICKIHLINNRNFSYNLLYNNKNNIVSTRPELYLNFGKYKNKSFSYVFNTDKLYCYNLAFWKKKNNNINCKNININLFINYIKQQISL